MAGRPARPARRCWTARPASTCDFLFAVRARRVAKHYINDTIIPMLCRKAGVPAADVRGNITSHRARSTIASQLYNAKEPMTLFELQAWLGHRTPAVHPALRQDHPEHAGQGLQRRRLLRPQRPHHRSPPRPRRRHLRRRPPPASPGSTTTSATATAPTPSSSSVHTGWPAPAATSTPRRTPAKGQLLEAKDNLQRMLATVPLTDDERAAVDDGQAALDQLLERLVDVPTPAGRHPPPDRRPGDRDPAADRRSQAGQTGMNLTNQIPQKRRKVHRQRPPLDAVTGHIPDRVQHGTQIMRHRPPARTTAQLGHHGLGLRTQQLPLGIGGIRGITRHALVTRTSRHAAPGLRGLNKVDRHPRASGRSSRWYSSATRSPFSYPAATRHRDQIATHRHLGSTHPTSFTNRL